MSTDRLATHRVPSTLRLLVTSDDPRATLTRIRLREPLEPLARRHGWQIDWMRHGDARWLDLTRWDLLLVQRGASRVVLDLMRRMQASGGRVLYDIDDLLTQPAAHLLHHAELQAARDTVRAALRQADRVMVSTPVLVGELRSLPGMSKQLLQLAPNAALPQALQTPRRVHGAPTRVVLAASDQLAAPWLAPALARAQALRPGLLRVQAIGAAAALLAGHGVDFEALPLLPREQYWPWLAETPNTVLLAPLDHSRFSACKSACKFLDAASVGVPVFASHRAPFDSAMLHGRTGWLLPDDAESWLQALLMAADDPCGLQAMADAARADALRRFGIDATSACWDQALRAEHRRVAARRRTPLGEHLRHLVHGLQQLNRQRLQRRRLARSSGGTTAGAQGGQSVLPT